MTQTPQGHISIGHLGPYNVTLQGNSYTLTAVCSLTAYLMTIPIKVKRMMTVQTIYFWTSY